jgi:class 3 adenylate cyclase
MKIPETQYAKSGDLYIAYQVVGSGPIDVVLAPPFMSHIEQNWEWPPRAHLQRRLASFSRLITFDRRGTGLSDRISVFATFDELMDDIRAVMEAAGSERAALIGMAEGGPMCALFAATHPERTSALVLYGTYAKATRSPDYPWAPTPEHHRRVLDTYDRKWGREPVGVGKLAPSLYSDERFRRFLARAERYAVSPGAAIAWYRTTTEIDIRHVLPTIRIPTLVCHRTGDRMFDISGARYMAEQITDARFVELSGEDVSYATTPAADQLADEIEVFLTGQRGKHEIDRVLATVLFTDIVGSTERVAQVGDRRWRETLEAHNEIVRGQLEAFRGREVKTVGDGFLATFDGPARAIRCAETIREEVRALGLEVRAGLHTGECEIADGDVRGIAVHIGARIAAMAGASEILVSNTVKDLVVGSGIEFEDRGSHALKGLPGEWRLYAVAT